MPAMLMAMLPVSMKALQSIQHHVFPNACVCCHKLMPNQQESNVCCQSCMTTIKVTPKYTCLNCGKPLQASLAPGPCGACLQLTLPQIQTQSLYIYTGTVRAAILAWKLQGQASAIQWLLETATHRLYDIFSADDLLIPVPMPMYRMRRSGLHHSADLCQMICHIVGCTMDWRILRRKGVDVRQSSLHGKARQRNLHRAFALSSDYADRMKNHHVQGKVWVIDDILTTGATLRHACKAMKRAHNPVSAFSFARVLRDV